MAFLLFCSEPPEADVHDEHDEEHASGSQLSVGGACVQVLGVTAVLLGQAGQVTGLRVQSCVWGGGGGAPDRNISKVVG